VSRTLAFGLLAILLATAFVRLGFWQLERAGERAAADAEARRRLELPPVELGRAVLSGPAATDELAHRRARAAGRYDPAREVVARGRAWRGSPGVELLTPLRLRDGGEVWVDRGWVPSPDAESVDRAAHAEPGPARVRGVLRPPTRVEREGGVQGLVVQQDPEPSRRGYPRREVALPGAGPHLGYAVQWFAFAAIALVGAAIYVWSRLRAPRPEPSTIGAGAACPPRSHPRPRR
jgi:surfeit locus 1 family protein